MPQKEIDIVINDRDIEQSEKKLRKLDKNATADPATGRRTRTN